MDWWRRQSEGILQNIAAAFLMGGSSGVGFSVAASGKQVLGVALITFGVACLALLVALHIPPRRKLRVVGTASDKRAILAVGGKVVEFDVFANQFYRGLDNRQKRVVTRAVEASDRTSYNERAVRAALDGATILEEEWFPMKVSHGVRFWTRSEIDAMEPNQRSMVISSVPLWVWWKGLPVPDIIKLLKNGVETPEQRSGDGLLGGAPTPMDGWKDWTKRRMRALGVPID